MLWLFHAECKFICRSNEMLCLLALLWHRVAFTLPVPLHLCTATVSDRCGHKTKQQMNGYRPIVVIFYAAVAPQPQNSLANICNIMASLSHLAWNTQTTTAAVIEDIAFIKHNETTLIPANNSANRLLCKCAMARRENLSPRVRVGGKIHTKAHIPPMHAALFTIMTNVSYHKGNGN